ncbi:peroxiredoxin [Aurantiacibacter poecillastricola]|uniref:peroxiredoxin n=1 Tax=Aurantiacibacter poecillastricola TaxID=3064385 RepID=UPI00273E2892|nr:peroxiredoxin [Aurantiacibacter sp. 219JJ12-13]MDP5261120.1 peroxiredoxin [Aurantiacibacter sp. 219JJ12-13]
MNHTTEDAPLRIGQTVPVFTARSTTGPFDLADYRGRWIMLFSHPADFTPVCTSEFVALAKASDEFEALDCALVAVSIDSLYSHLAWIRMIYDMTGTRIEFPIVEDPTMEIARAYGMIGPEASDAATIRTTYFIDPDGVLLASQTYPVTVGRSIPELLRLLKALQKVRGGKVYTPANWQPGDQMLKIPAETAADTFAGKNPTDWFYTPVKDKN